MSGLFGQQPIALDQWIQSLLELAFEQFRQIPEQGFIRFHLLFKFVDASMQITRLSRFNGL